MIKFFYGENRVAATEQIQQFLGKSYEVVEGADLSPDDLPSLLKGRSLFGDKRSILIRDLTVNKPVFEKIIDYLDTPHQVAILEAKLDERTAAYKSIQGHIPAQEFTFPRNKDANTVFDVYRLSKQDGPRAVKALRRIEPTQEPFMFLGLMIAQAIRDFASHPGATEKSTLQDLAQLDMRLKSTQIDPWTLIEAFLIKNQR